MPTQQIHKINKKFRIAEVLREEGIKYIAQQKFWLFFWRDLGYHWKGNFYPFTFPRLEDAKWFIETRNSK